MKKNVPDDKRIQAILDLICALDGRIMKVERDGNLLIVYADIQSYEKNTGQVQHNGDYEEVAFDVDDYSDYADCYHTCENYKAVSETDWRCVNFCSKCQSCMQDAA